ncbi:MAG: type II toxin-antitoxin system VapC family toxin [Acidobacteria bacterium]|nr:type II toxin-antitoxin system VapC family toxin [Acidobacteriota bacterium]
MDIKLLPAGKDVLIDTNIFVYYLSNLSPECKETLRRIARGELNAFVTTVIVAELLHRRMIAEAVMKGLISPGQPVKRLKAQPHIIQQLTDYITHVEMLLQLPLQLVEVTAGDIQSSHALRRAYGLFVNDSINLACALRLGIANIATHDADFARVPLVTVWEPTDV